MGVVVNVVMGIAQLIGRIVHQAERIAVKELTVGLEMNTALGL